MITEANDRNSEIHLLDMLLHNTYVVWVRLVVPSLVSTRLHLFTQLYHGRGPCTAENKCPVYI
jgi:hypothetical protein